MSVCVWLGGRVVMVGFCFGGVGVGVRGGCRLGWSNLNLDPSDVLDFLVPRMSCLIHCFPCSLSL